MSHALIRLVPLVVVLAACADEATLPTAPDASLARTGATGIVQVTSPASDGPGSVRAALAAASADPSITRIALRPNLGAIMLTEGLAFTGTQDLVIEGQRAVIDGSLLPADTPALFVTGGGDLAVQQLTLRGATGTGMTVAIPAEAAGTIRLAYRDVRFEGNASHGLLINDQAEYFSNEFSESEEGSAASVDVEITNSAFVSNGRTALDRDGLRVNEGGLGDLRTTMRNVLVEANGGDGVELDERGDGSIRFDIRHVDILRNGDFDLVVDPDDGLDLDEAGAGDIVGTFTHVVASGNFEQGLDLNENGAGDLRVDLLHVTAEDNLEEGIEYEEDDDVAGGGDIVATIRQVVVRRNGAADGDAGLKLREKGEGNLFATIEQVEATDNAVGGIQVREDANGTLTASFRQVIATGNDGDGIEFDENGAGNLVGRVASSTARDNADAGVDADQAGAGVGTLELFRLTGGNNGDGDVELGGTTVIDG